MVDMTTRVQYYTYGIAGAKTFAVVRFFRRFSSKTTGAQPHVPPARFARIADNYSSIEEVQDALRAQGLESSQLILGFDFTKSNEWTGKRSFRGRSLHSLASGQNPYEQVISLIVKTLSSFDDDQLIPCYGFGDASTNDRDVFSFFSDNRPAQGLDEVLARYRQIVPNVRLAGPTSFAPIIHQAMQQVIDSCNQLHVLVIVADGNITRSVDVPQGQHSTQERATFDAIVYASKLPLSIILVGVGDGPFDTAQQMDDELPQREFDNFQFVNFTQLQQRTMDMGALQREAAFAREALQELPEQYRTLLHRGLIGCQPNMHLRPNRTPLPPPPGVRAMDEALLHQVQQPPGSGYYPGLSNGQSSRPPYAAAEPLSAPAAPPQQRAEEPDPMFICPITQDLMTAPVIAADGYSYEQAAIVEWFARHDRSPMTGAALEHKHMIPNHQLRSAIMEFRERQRAAGGGS